MAEGLGVTFGFRGFAGLGVGRFQGPTNPSDFRLQGLQKVGYLGSREVL